MKKILFSLVLIFSCFTFGVKAIGEESIVLESENYLQIGLNNGQLENIKFDFSDLSFNPSDIDDIFVPYSISTDGKKIFAGRDIDFSVLKSDILRNASEHGIVNPENLISVNITSLFGKNPLEIFRVSPIVFNGILAEVFTFVDRNALKGFMMPSDVLNAYNDLLREVHRRVTQHTGVTTNAAEHPNRQVNTSSRRAN